MKHRKDNGAPKKPVKPSKPDAAFDTWLQRGLHDLFDGIASEPIPEEILRILDEDRKE